MKCLFIVFSLLISNITTAADCLKKEITEQLKLVKEDAIRSAGRINDFDQRISGLLQIYEDSGKNFLFPFVASHGALFARKHMDKKDKLLTILNFSTIVLRPRILRELNFVSHELKRINRLVFIDVYTHYYFISANRHCSLKELSKIVNKSVAALIYQSQGPYRLSNTQRLSHYKTMLKYEQQNVVQPAMKSLINKLRLSRFYKTFLFSPKVRFAYFPNGHSFKFKNFFDLKERIDWANKAAEIAIMQRY